MAFSFVGYWLLVEVSVFPGETGFARGVGEKEVATDEADFPLLAGGLELDRGGSFEAEASDGSEINHLGVKAMAVTVAGEGQCMDVGEGVHQPSVWFWEV